MIDNEKNNNYIEEIIQRNKSSISHNELDLEKISQRRWLYAIFFIPLILSNIYLFFIINNIPFNFSNLAFAITTFTSAYFIGGSFAILDSMKTSCEAQILISKGSVDYVSNLDNIKNIADLE